MGGCRTASVRGDDFAQENGLTQKKLIDINMRSGQ